MPDKFQHLLLTIQVRLELAKSTNFTVTSLWLYRKIHVLTLSQNLIHFAIRCHRENIWVLQLNIAYFEKNIIVYYALWGRNLTFHVECDVSSMSRRRVPYTSHETKVQFRLIILLIIFTEEFLKKTDALYWFVFFS